MQLTIEILNFDTGALQLLVEGAIDDHDRTRLIEYVEDCRKMDIPDITLRYHGSMPPASTAILNDIAAATGAKTTTRTPKRNASTGPTPVVQFEFRRIDSPDLPEEQNYEYCFSFSKLDTVLDKIHSIISLIGESMNLDSRTLSRLQLCVYELAVNSVEHGTFETGSPTITLVISSDPTHVTVCYKDNADIFLTKRHQPVDIGNQIKIKNIRGLGLFIMNRLTHDFVYKRLSNWNVTMFKIEKQRPESIQDPGREKMNSISIKLMMCDLENSIIIQPFGAIDASSTKNMEEHFNNLLKDHKQFIIVDFSQVTFISSSGIGILLGTVSSLRERGGDLIFMKVPARIREIFDILNITDYFITVSSAEELAGAIPAK